MMCHRHLGPVRLLQLHQPQQCKDFQVLQEYYFSNLGRRHLQTYLQLDLGLLICLHRHRHQQQQLILRLCQQGQPMNMYQQLKILIDH
jgi:hypothetical protein